jgi:hypothetical protein
MELRALIIHSYNEITEDMNRRVINITDRVEEVAKHNGDLSEILGFRTLSIVLVLKTNKGKHDVSETGSVSVLR